MAKTLLLSSLFTAFSFLTREEEDLWSNKGFFKDDKVALVISLSGIRPKSDVVLIEVRALTDNRVYRPKPHSSRSANLTLNDRRKIYSYLQWASDKDLLHRCQRLY